MYGDALLVLQYPSWRTRDVVLVAYWIPMLVMYATCGMPRAAPLIS